MQSFSSEVINKIKYYVYLLSDPRTDEVFYVGKGKGNRVFSHLKDTAKNKKVEKIQELKKQDLKPKIEFLVHGVEDEVTIKKIEAAIIDLIGKKRLTNIVGGYESSSFGRMAIDQIEAKYTSKKATIKENVVLIKLSDTFRYNMDSMDLYDYTRGRWIISEERRKKINYAFAVYDGIIQETYNVSGWFEAGKTLTNRHEQEKWLKHPRWEFVGNVSKKMRKKYRYKSVEHYWKTGARNPIRYTFK